MLHKKATAIYLNIYKTIYNTNAHHMPRLTNNLRIIRF